MGRDRLVPVAVQIGPLSDVIRMAQDMHKGSMQRILPEHPRPDQNAAPRIFRVFRSLGVDESSMDTRYGHGDRVRKSAESFFRYHRRDAGEAPSLSGRLCDWSRRHPADFRLEGARCFRPQRGCPPGRKNCFAVAQGGGCCRDDASRRRRSSLPRNCRRSSTTRTLPSLLPRSTARRST